MLYVIRFPPGEVRNQPCCHGQIDLHLPEGGASYPLQRLHAGTGLSCCLSSVGEVPSVPS